MDYYAVVMSTMIALYGAMYASSLIREERVRNTALRLVAAPISKGEIFLGKILGCLTVNSLCLLAVVAFSHFVYKADWGDHIGVVLLLLLSEVFLAASFGLGMSYITKTGESSRMIITIVIQLSSFFGGAYFKIENPTGILNVITHLSPLTWVNQAITKIIYANDLGAAITPIALNLGIAILFLAIAIVSFQRREGL
jgi:ABC-2 type transport system permease protein